MDDDVRRAERQRRLDQQERRRSHAAGANPRKLAAVAKARAALATKREAEKSSAQVDGGRAPQICEGGAPSPPSHTGGQDFPRPSGDAGVSENHEAGSEKSEAVKEHSAQAENRRTASQRGRRGATVEQRPGVPTNVPGAMSAHDAVMSEWKKPAEPKVTKLPDGRLLVE